MQRERIHDWFDRRLEQEPQRVFLETLDGPLSFADLGVWVAQLELELRGQGVRPGDRVLVIAENCPQHVALIMACSRVGAWSCNVNARMAEGEIDAFDRKADARVLYFTAGVSDAAAAHGRRYGATDSVVAGLTRSPVRQHATAESEPLASAVAAIIFTSGSTGAAKGVMMTHAGLLQYARTAIAWREMTPRDRSHAYLPMTHIFGLGALLLASLGAGASLVMRSRFDPADVFDALARHGITNLQGPPALFARLLAWLDENGIARPGCPDLRYLYSGAAPLDPALKQAVEARFGQPLYHGYGMSEYAGGVTMVRYRHPRDDTSAGCVLDGAQMRLVGPDGDDVPPGSPGEIWVRGAGLMAGYFRDPEATAEVMRPGGWYASGDIGRRGPDGALFVVGRSKEMIIRSGFNVYPGEIEAALNRHPAIRQAAVVGRKLGDGNEEVLAFVELAGPGPLDTGAVAAYLATQLAPYKQPSRIIAVDVLPMTASGKLLKRALLERPEFEPTAARSKA